ncbi:MAG: hypothetical protein B7Z55_00705 [Planctomycetales bacterium 12-60-4]|nr:MAG: hypothetical protein B7Z55_00705 [Planctomycetales bacterium 12-60-4]
MPQDVAKYLAKRMETQTRSFPALAAESAEVGGASAPESTPIVLDRWDIQTHVYQQEAVIKTGLFGGLFGGDVKHVRAGVIQEAKRFGIAETSEKRRLEIGVALRLSVATDLDLATISLTIPNIAASAQLKNSRTRIGLSVIGFVGPLGDLLPAADDLNVESFSVFIDAFKKIQAYVLGKGGEQFLAPTFLGYDDAAASSQGGGQ